MRTVSGSVLIAADAAHAQTAPQIALADKSLTLAGSSSSRIRAAPARHTTPDPPRTLTRTRGLAWMFRTQPARRPPLGYQPEGLPIEAVAHRGAPRHAGAPPGRLQQGVARRREAQVMGEQDDRVDHPRLEGVDNTILDR